MPQFTQLGGGDPNISKRAGLSAVTATDCLHKALKEDADWLTGAVTPKQPGDHRRGAAGQAGSCRLCWFPRARGGSPC
jgi:hypothetical protein